jgi:hypothetical protein
MGTATLRIWHSNGRIEDRTLGDGEHEVGRSAGALILDDPGVSTRHARIAVRGGVVTIEDLGSSNGVSDAQGRRLQGASVLQVMQPVQLGGTRVALISTSVGAPATQLMPVMSAPASGGHGAPPAPTYGAPAAAYGPPPGSFAAPVGGYGPPPAAAYGAPPQAGLAPWESPMIGASPQAPYGIDPVTGQPFSDKSKLVAGLLQLFFGSFAVGRFYLGYTSLAIAQIAAVFVIGGFGSVFTCGASLFILLWPMIDGIMMLIGKVPDAQGRPLRA